MGAPRSAQAHRARAPPPGTSSHSAPGTATERTPTCRHFRPQPAGYGLRRSPGARGKNSSGRSSSSDRRGGGLSPAPQKLGGGAVLPPPHVVTSLASVLPPGGPGVSRQPLVLSAPQGLRTHLGSALRPGPSSQDPESPWACPRPSASLLPVRHQRRLAGSPPRVAPRPGLQTRQR